MRDLKPSDNGRKFSGIIEEMRISDGKVRYRDNSYWLCQNGKNGDNCGAEKFGYAYSWSVGNGSVDSMKMGAVNKLDFYPLTEKEVEEYKDFQIGDKLVCKEDCCYDREVVGIIGDNLVVTKDLDGTDDIGINLKDKLYKNGWRLEYVPEEVPVVELSVAEVASKLGINPKTLKIVDK